MDPIYLSNLSNSTYDLSLLSSQWQACLVVLYTCTALVSLSSNLLVIVIIVRRDRVHQSELWLLLMNLSVSDVLMSLFCIPFTYTTFVLGHWIFPTWLCPLVQSAQHCSVFVSVYTLTVIGFDRYLAIVYPLHGVNYVKSHKLHILLYIWLGGILFSSIQMFKTEAVSYRNGNETYYDCKELWGEVEGKLYTVFVFVLTFALPVSALLFVYASIGRHIILRTVPGNPNLARDLLQSTTKIKVIKMLVMIVIVFIVCWLPLQLFTMVVWLHSPSIHNASAYTFYIVSCLLCHWLAMAHSFVNPFIYGFMSNNFKTSLRKIFCPRRRTESHSKSEAELERLSNLTHVALSSGHSL